MPNDHALIEVRARAAVRTAAPLIGSLRDAFGRAMPPEVLSAMNAHAEQINLLDAAVNAAEPPRHTTGSDEPDIA